MKKILDPELEKGRVMTGPMRSTAEDGPNGVFMFKNQQGSHIRLIASDGMGWEHVSVSLLSMGANQEITIILPTWETMCFVKSLFWDEEECVIEYHPPKSRYVNVHPGVLHLWRPCEGPGIPMPPLIMV